MWICSNVGQDWKSHELVRAPMGQSVGGEREVTLGEEFVLKPPHLPSSLI